MTMVMEHITENARRSFDAILARAIQLRLKQREGDRVVISASSLAVAEMALAKRTNFGAASAANPGATSTRTSESSSMLAPGVVVVTIASITFRLLFMLQIDETPATRRYFLGDDLQRPFEDAVSELANLCGGVMNQALLRYFPDLGMSTPYRLDAPCLGYLQALTPQYQNRFSIVIEAASNEPIAEPLGETAGEAIKCIATICVSANAPLNFAAEIDVEAVDTGGELEFF